jgi:23S rRNA (cytosine1962-C5)-methyltransferase
MPKAQLKSGREKSVLRHHPWIFSGAISHADEGIDSGETVDVLDSKGAIIARGAYSPNSQIRIRVWTWDLSENIDADFIKRRINNAIAFRKRNLDLKLITSYRIIYGEVDGLPGFVVDRYDDILVVQCTTCGADRWRDIFIELLCQLTGIKTIVERSDVDIRDLEGLSKRSGLVTGNISSGLHLIKENDLIFGVDVFGGQKTGFYLDQRENRALMSLYAANKDVLDCFAYTGGFTISLLAGGAKSVVAVDSSKTNLDIAKHNCTLNNRSLDRVEWIVDDVFKYLRYLRDKGKKFDLIVLDPPKFAPTSKHISKATRGYKDINLLGFKLLRAGGMLSTFSCSGGISQELFQKVVSDAALDANVRARIINRFHQAPDHPVLLSFPEGEYLKGLLLQVE